MRKKDTALSSISASTRAGAGACSKKKEIEQPADNGPEIARQVEQWRVQFSATNTNLTVQIEALKIKLSSEVKKL